MGLAKIGEELGSYEDVWSFAYVSGSSMHCCVKGVGINRRGLERGYITRSMS